MKLFYQDSKVTEYQGHILDVLPTLPAQSVHCIVTSPPYWGLRDYGLEPQVWPDGWKGSLGLEDTPELYIQHIVQVFREIWRVLRKDGTVWLNLGSSYAGGTRDYNSFRRDRAHVCVPRVKIAPGFKPKDLVPIPWMVAMALHQDGWWLRSDIIWSKPNPMPESVTDRPTRSHEYVFLLTKSQKYFYDADAVKEEGAQNKWGKYSNPKYGATNGVKGKMQSAKDLTKDEYLEKYQQRNLRSVWTIATQPFPDAHFATFPEKLVEPCIKAGTSEKGCCPECGAPWVRIIQKDLSECATEFVQHRDVQNPYEIGKYLNISRIAKGLTQKQIDEAMGMITMCSWWEGRPAGIQTPTVGQWDKLKILLNMDDRFDGDVAKTKKVEVTIQPEARADLVCPSRGAVIPQRKTIGWKPSCQCAYESLKKFLEIDVPKPCTVLDPFGGSGVTAIVAKKLGRKCIIIELKEEYCQMPLKRLSQEALEF